MLSLRVALFISATLAAPTARPAHDVSADSPDYLVMEVQKADASDYVSDYDPNMKEQKKVLNGRVKENRIAAQKNANSEAANSASLLQRNRHEDEPDEEMGERMAKRKADHEKQMELQKAEREAMRMQKQKQREDRKAEHAKMEAAKAKRNEVGSQENDGKWVPDEASGNDGKYHPKDDVWKQDKDGKDPYSAAQKSPAALARFLSGLPGGATGPAARMATRTAERARMKEQRQAEKERMKEQRQQQKAADKKAGTAVGATQELGDTEVGKDPFANQEQPVADTETSAEWYSKATKKLHSTKNVDEGGLPKKAREHSDTWKVRHEEKVTHADAAIRASDANAEPEEAEPWPAEKKTKEPEGLDAYDFNAASTHGSKSKKGNRGNDPTR